MLEFLIQNEVSFVTLKIECWIMLMFSYNSLIHIECTLRIFNDINVTFYICQF